MSVVEIARDTAGLQACAAAFFDHGMRVVNAGERADQVPLPKVSPAHLGWVEYLLEVDMAVDKYPAVAASLPADVIQGLGVLDKARQQFKREHKQCQHCGRWTALFSPRCVCSKDLRT